jgi:hypothetical protein
MTKEILILAEETLLLRALPAVGERQSLVIMLGPVQERKAVWLPEEEACQLLAWLKKQFPEDLDGTG